MLLKLLASGLLLASAGLLTSTPALAAGELFGVQSNSDQVFRIDTATAAVTLEGTIAGLSGNSLGGLEQGPDGLHYGVTTGNAAALFRIDSSTWEATLVSSLGAGFCFEGGLAIAPDGSAWMVNCGSASAAELRSVDLASGATTLVGVLSGGNRDINGLDWRSDGMLVGIDRVSNAVVEIDPSNAAVTNLVTVAGTVGASGGMAVEGSTGLFCTSGPGSSTGGTNELFQFDPFTGTPTLIAGFSGPQSGNGFSALARTGGSLGASFCSGDGSGTACPCANTGAPGSGCANSSGVGAALTRGGTTLAAADDMTFACTDLLPGQPALLFVGNNAVNGGLGVLFGDGLRCVGGGVIRLGVAVPDAGGGASWGPGLGASGGWSAGDLRRFQVWYRDPVNSPCASAFNLSAGIEVSFL